MLRAWAGAIALVWVAGCGSRSPLARSKPYDGGPARVVVESCNGLDDDGDGHVDEDFRDARGNYLNDANCGRCGQACDQAIANALELDCELVADLPTCVARVCAPGFGRTRSGGCVAEDDQLCKACREAADCGTLATARCVEIGGEPHCTRDCADGCPHGYVCQAGDHCEPESSSCTCEGSVQDFALACELHGPVSGCTGSAQCKAGMLSICEAPAERCDGLDNDCDGTIDEDFVDQLGAYSLSLSNCGACGVSCRSDQNAGVQLACGGDPFAPSCVTSCPDTADGIQVGDHLDADRRIDNGCECVVTALSDSSGAPANERQLDANCDGADGNVLTSFYVTLEGDDSGPGSPTRPLRNIGTAIERAYESIGSAHPRTHVYVASGVYTESVRMRDGVSLHGGYRSDFLAENPSGFPVVVVAPADTTALGGAPLVVDHAGQSASLIEGFSFRGRDAANPGEPAVGIELVSPGAQLTLRNLTVRTGKPGPGQAGARGDAGSTSSSIAGNGDPPRAAFEDASHTCMNGDSDRGRGGGGAQNRCGGIDVSGGGGGSSVCPVFAEQAAGGQPGHARAQLTAGVPGHGGVDLEGPIMNDPSCPASVCCGLADFTVPGNFTQATAGGAGENGELGTAGAACSDPFGSFPAGADTWNAGPAHAGGDGDAGGGGGGGGSGAGAQMTWVAGMCEFPDGLGGGGGGGGAGGCGGKGGAAGAAGGPAIGILIRATDAQALPTLQGVQVVTQDGGVGGDGGAGGDGALGGNGGFGGRVPDALRSTPPLAGPMPGERGGKGGDGGAGGGGGGGCGGSAVGVWLTGLGVRADLVMRFQNANHFVLGAGGLPGRGGGGAVPAASGTVGTRVEVIVQ